MRRTLLALAFLFAHSAAFAQPNYLSHVEAATQRWPAAWAQAGHEGAQKYDFIKILASYLHYEVDAAVGLNGKYQSNASISDDGIAILGPCPITNISPENTGRAMCFIDVIVASGSAAQRPAWQNLSGTTPSQGYWIKPPRVHDSGPTKPPVPPVTPTPVAVDLQPVLDAIAALTTKVDAIAALAVDARDAASNAADRAGETKAIMQDARDRIETLVTTQHVLLEQLANPPTYVGSTRAFGGRLELRPER
jgi:hypothetical protein